MSNVMTYSYKIWVEGKELSSDRLEMITQIDYENNCSGSDLLSISLADSDLKFFADTVLVTGKTIKFQSTQVMNGSTQTLTFQGYISVIDIDYPNDGVPTMTVHCMDSTYKMDRTPKKRTWEKITASDVAAQIFKEYGLTPVVTDTKTKEDNITQSNVTDIQFLTELASNQKSGEFICYVEDNKGYFVKKDRTAGTQGTVTYKGGNYDIYSFNPRITLDPIEDTE